jgi:hypothetical protein
MTNRERKLLLLIGILSITIIPWSIFIDSSNLDALSSKVNENEADFLILKSIKLPTDDVVSKIVSLSRAKFKNGYITVSGVDRALNLVRALEEYHYPIKSIKWNGTSAIISRR